jgi:hypothetical protein
MWSSFYTALCNELGKRAGLYLVVLLGSGAVGGVYWLDPFYHGGWILSYKGWLFVFIVICAIAILVSQSVVGLTIVAILALISSGGFAFLYKNSSFQYGEWPFWAWALHLLCVALIVGVLVGTGARLFGIQSAGAIGSQDKSQTRGRNGCASRRGRASKEVPPANAGGQNKLDD